ncbi:MAG: type 4a pilus biogenesis protein PilO [Candidatus Acidiferrales bacterium]
MNRNGTFWKRALGAALALLLLLDLSLAFVRWQAAQAAPQAMRQERTRLQTEARLLKADIDRARSIQQHMPDVGKECDRFYQEDLLPASAGYSAVMADLSDIAGKAGLRTSGLNFKQKDLKERGVTEIDIEASVEGDYPAIIHFINGLERSKNFYLMNDLGLDSQGTGGIRLKLALRTYFRV